jgi:uncharacterized protein (DUF885 family)
MKKILIPLTIVAFLFMTIGLLLSQQNEEDSKFEEFLKKYFEEMWKFYPTAATLAGFHKYDDDLENLSSKNIEKRHEALDELNQKVVAEIDKFKLSPELQIDHGMIVDALDLELFNHEALIPWEYDPIFYNNIFVNCVRSLLSKEFAPLDIRAKNASDRLKELPKLIKQAKENLKTPAQIFTETAIRQLPGILNYYRNELPQIITQVPETHKSKLQSSLSKVIPALEEYQNFLQNELLPRSTGNFRLGQQTHRRLVRLTFQQSIPLDELVARSKADYNNIRREMVFVCIPFFKIMYPNINPDQLGASRSEEEVRNIMIKGVLDKIKEEHAAKDEFMDRVKSTVEEIKNFILKKELLELPEEELNIEPMPLESQGITWTDLIRPGLYETSGTYVTQMTPLPDDWGEEQTTSFLEEYNNFLLYFWAVRKLYPGQFIPFYYTKQYPSLVRNMYPNMPLIKGWPIYIEEMLVNSGFGNYDLRLRLSQLKLYLRAVIDFQLDFNIHEGGMTKEQAIAYITRGGFQTKAEAQRKWNRILLNPGNSAFPYVGIQEILDMEKEYKQLKGDAFSQKEFLQKLLSYGALPIRYLKTKILEQQ